MSKTLEQTKAEMDARYAAGSAYPRHNLWDVKRQEQVHANVLELARFPDGLHCAPRKLGRTLDIACGSAGVAQYWPEPSMVTGLDLSSVAVEAASRSFPQTEYVAAAIEHYRPERKFDTVVAVESIEHWSDVAEGLASVRHMLGEDGVFVLTTPHRDSLHVTVGKLLGVDVPFCSSDHRYEYGYAELKELLAAHGFRVTRSLGSALMPYWALEQIFGREIRKLTDHHEDLVSLLVAAGRDIPHMAFIQCHACRLL